MTTEQRSKNGRKTLTVAEVSAALGLCLTTIYECVKRGEIPAMRIGDRVLFSRKALAERFPDVFGNDQTAA